MTLICVAYALTIGLGMVLLEGNLGTAFSHKGQLAWALLLTIVATGEWRRYVTCVADRVSKQVLARKRP